uniref:Uncharacterized protein n=1 Tax=Sphaerodactylus townsendi TaxID=933632 RepID=A0ACB8F4X4_9SAUR
MAYLLEGFMAVEYWETKEQKPTASQPNGRFEVARIWKLEVSRVPQLPYPMLLGRDAPAFHHLLAFMTCLMYAIATADPDSKEIGEPGTAAQECKLE